MGKIKLIHTNVTERIMRHSQYCDNANNEIHQSLMKYIDLYRFVCRDKSRRIINQYPGVLLRSLLGSPMNPFISYKWYIATCSLLQLLVRRSYRRSFRHDVSCQD